MSRGFFSGCAEEQCEGIYISGCSLRILGERFASRFRKDAVGRKEARGERGCSPGARGKSKEGNEFLSKKRTTVGRSRSSGALLYRGLNEIREKLREKQYASSRSLFTAYALKKLSPEEPGSVDFFDLSAARFYQTLVFPLSTALSPPPSVVRRPPPR